MQNFSSISLKLCLLGQKKNMDMGSILGSLSEVAIPIGGHWIRLQGRVSSVTPKHNPNSQFLKRTEVPSLQELEQADQGPHSDHRLSCTAALDQTWGL